MQNDPFTQEQFFAAYQHAPPLVQQTVAAVETTKVVVEMKNKYQLHVDQADIVGKGLGYVLLGLATAEQFRAYLAAGGISAPIIGEILQEFNQKIFIPLRDRIRQASSGVSVQPAASPTSRPSVPAPSYASSSPSAVSEQAPSPAEELHQQTVGMSGTAGKSLPTKGSRQAITIPVPEQPAFAPQVLMQQREAPQPPPNLPGAMPPLSAAPQASQTPAQPAETPARPVARVPAPPPRVPGTPDPYREPIE